MPHRSLSSRTCPHEEGRVVPIVAVVIQSPADMIETEVLQEPLRQIDTTGRLTVPTASIRLDRVIMTVAVRQIVALTMYVDGTRSGGETPRRLSVVKTRHRCTHDFLMLLRGHRAIVAEMVSESGTMTVPKMDV